MAQPLLTKKRARWVAPRKATVIKGRRLSYNASVQVRYVSALTRITRKMTEQTKREITRLFAKPVAEEFFSTAMDADIASQARILTNKLINKFSTLFGQEAKPLAERMISATNKVSKSNLHTSLKQLSGGLSIKTNVITPALKTIVKASVTENVALIKSIAEEYLSSVQKTVMRAITQGNGLQDIIPALEKYGGISERKAKNIAFDQTRKVYNNMNAQRMQKIGVQRFEWVHSGGGQKPREDHIAMSGNIYSFDDLPVIDAKTGETGIPGQAVNCMCTMVPVVEFDDGEETDE